MWGVVFTACVVFSFSFFSAKKAHICTFPQLTTSGIILVVARLLTSVAHVLAGRHPVHLVGSVSEPSSSNYSVGWLQPDSMW